MKLQVGTITLKKQFKFTEYSEYAAWTDYVTCEPQTVPLYRDDYWVFAYFDGILTSTTFPENGFRKVGQPWKAHCQTQKFGGIGQWMDCELYSVELSPSYRLQEHGKLRRRLWLICWQADCVSAITGLINAPVKHSN